MALGAGESTDLVSYSCRAACFMCTDHSGRLKPAGYFAFVNVLPPSFVMACSQEEEEEEEEGEEEEEERYIKGRARTRESEMERRITCGMCSKVTYKNLGCVC